MLLITNKFPVSRFAFYKFSSNEVISGSVDDSFYSSSHSWFRDSYYFDSAPSADCSCFPRNPAVICFVYQLTNTAAVIRSFTKVISQRLRVFPSNFLTVITCRLKNRHQPLDYHQPINEKFQLIKNFNCFLSFLLFQEVRRK